MSSVLFWRQSYKILAVIFKILARIHKILAKIFFVSYRSHRRHRCLKS